jgi:hypothetical protein
MKNNIHDVIEWTAMAIEIIGITIIVVGCAY